MTNNCSSSWAIHDAYSLEYEQELSDSKSQGYVYRHKKSGARVAVVKNEDSNKVFLVGFRTPPEDSTGVAHIIEHTVLCGSKQFPLKDPFIELAKGSLNTFLNAMTFPDKTIYPIASCNDKDFKNLMHVYMDAVFRPKIYERKEVFEQEGWYYVLESKEAELDINGIVYSEMKGALSSPESLLASEVMNTLFPDNAYGYESGGDPKAIPDLSYEQFLAFHRKNYHPSNSYIYLYGDVDIEERLKWMDQEYLSDYEEVLVKSNIDIQQAFGSCKEVLRFYPVSESEEIEEEGSYLCYAAALGTSLDVELCIAMQTLIFALFSSVGAPVKQALLDAGIGKDILSDFENSIYQPIFMITAKHADSSKKHEFMRIIKETLKKEAAKGINKNSLAAAINLQEFRYREADYGRHPKGLAFGIDMLSSWLYDDSKAFSYLELSPVFEKLKKEIGTGYFESLVEKWMIDSDHSILLILEPDPGLNKHKEEALKRKLADYKKSLSEEQILAIIEDNVKLLAYQDSVPTKEEIESIPLLTREDIEKKAADIYNEEREIDGVPVLYHSIFTNNIAYFYLRFRMDHIPERLLPYAGLLTRILTSIDTERHNYQELSNEINIHTGGMGSELGVYAKKNDTDAYRTLFSIGTKVLYKEIHTALKFMLEVIGTSKLSDTKRLREIMEECRSKLQIQMNYRADDVAVERAKSYISQSAYFQELTDGIRFYRFLEYNINHFEAEKQKLVDCLEELASMLFCKENLFVDLTADEEGYRLMSGYLPEVFKSLDKQVPLPAKADRVPFLLERLNEGFMTPDPVQYVVCAGNFLRAGYSYSGSLKVLRSIMSLEYLYQNIRVKGGAYGASLSFSALDGFGYFSSYRDPNLAESLDIYQNAYEFIKNFEVDDRELTKYIIGTISSMDTPLSPAMKGRQSFSCYMCGITPEDMQKERDEVLSCCQDDIRAAAPVLKAIFDEGVICVVGNEKKIQQNKELFGQIKQLYGSEA